MKTNWFLKAQTWAALLVALIVGALQPGDELIHFVARLVLGVTAPVAAYHFVGALLAELRADSGAVGALGSGPVPNARTPAARG